MYYQNVRGLRTKLVELLCSAVTCDYDIIVLTETWLDYKISDVELGLSEYSIYRKDRSDETSSKSRGGGVLIAVKKYIISNSISTPQITVEDVFVGVKINNNNILIGGVYIPPMSAVNIYEDHCANVDFVVETYPQHTLYLIGDYNLPNVVFTNDDLGTLILNNNNHIAQTLCDSFAFHNLYQINSIKNCHGVFLDLIFTHNNKAEVKLADDCLLPLDQHHPAILVNVNINENIETLQSDYYYYEFKKANYMDLNYYYSTVDWQRVLSDAKDINEAVDLFYTIVLNGIHLFVPQVRFKTPKFAHWFSPDLKQLIVSKKLAHKKYKHTQLREDYLTFSHLRAQCKILTKECYRNYIQNAQNSVSTNIKFFWNFVNAKRKDHGLPQQMYLNDEIGNNGYDIVNLFANHFQSVYVNENPTMDTVMEYSNSTDINSCDITLECVLNKLSALDIRKSSGPDNIPPLLLKKCRFSLAQPLHYLFSSSLKSGLYPIIWKSSYITPILKTGDKADIKNYRPICILSTIPKILEDIVNEQINDRLAQLIIEEQHGFSKGKSTTTNLLLFVQTVLEALENRCQVDAVFTDFSKAFDTVNHVILVKKLEAIGLHGSLLRWLNSYIQDRKQLVRACGFISREIEVTSGVPQGSHLGPLLFNIFINDIKSEIIHCQFLLFADDLKIFNVVNSSLDCEKIQQDLNNITAWCSRNHLNLNISKCKSITFTKAPQHKHSFTYNLDGISLETVNYIKDLGVIVDSKLNFKLHYESIINKAIKMIGFICRHTREFDNIQSLKCLYYTLVRTILEYASTVWSPSYQIHIESIEKVQNRFLRYMSYKTGIPAIEFSATQARVQFNIQKLSTRRNHADVVLIYKIMNNVIKCSDLLSRFALSVPVRSTRSIQMFAVSFHRCNYGKSSPISRITAVANNVQIDFFSNSLNQFKSKLGRILV